MNRPGRWIWAFVLTSLLVVFGVHAGQSADHNGRGLVMPARSTFIPIQEQPFYPDLEEDAGRLSEVVLGQVVGDSPQATLLNFYAVMAEVGRRAEALGQVDALEAARANPAARREEIEDTSLLFQQAVSALDASVFPASVRVDMSEEAAIRLKHVLDYVFTHSVKPISIPDAREMKSFNDLRLKPVEAWRIPGTAITLTTEVVGDPENNEYFFSAETVSRINKMYGEIRDLPVVRQPFATPGFYKNFILTPGYLVPPDWYLGWPEPWRAFLELPFFGQTVFQIVCAVLVVVIYSLVTFFLLRMLVLTWREPFNPPGIRKSLLQQRLAWRRLLIIVPLVPLTSFAKYLIGDVVNFTAFPLVVVTYAAYVIKHLAGSVVAYLLFEALGRSIARITSHLRGAESQLRQQRVSSLVIPLCRAIGVLVAALIFYRLLLRLGLPASTLLAFSAVPGLAIGLGASKLLGNLFAGFSIQTDRPLRVGEFCMVGENIGYINKIGLRSLEMQTLESRVTIPNSVADEATIVNYSRSHRTPSPHPVQSLDLKIPLDSSMSPFQLRELLKQARRFLDANSLLQQPLVTLHRRVEDDSETLVVFAIIELHGWESYLALREVILVRLVQLVAQAKASEVVLPVARGSSPAQLQCVPGLVQQALMQDPNLEFFSCRLERIAPYSYDYVIELGSTHDDHNAFEDSMHSLNRRLIQALCEQGIDIPYPTQTLNFK
ncbi:mechanosensitive ion channel family protein [Synechococcus sp. RS9916]|uniref:mechanosensitive ion channel family protein n=1 Tax=Synechococcus sp. RS9916 TaxID=221359 RepID=UPI0000E53F36|nr:mechanosensitive ion channel domain-containing protein [Synechococcus sp. RS9916]EAU73925.1 MscS Mechanosensitive ion channel [Synechococcus sp. RS9916]